MKIKAIIASIGLTVAAAGALTVGLASNNSGTKEVKANYTGTTVFNLDQIDWVKDDAKFGVYYFYKVGDVTSNEGWSTGLASVSTYEKTFSVNYDLNFEPNKMIIVRYNSEATTTGWGNKWDQTQDLPFSTDIICVTSDKWYFTDKTSSLSGDVNYALDGFKQKDDYGWKSESFKKGLSFAENDSFVVSYNSVNYSAIDLNEHIPGAFVSEGGTITCKIPGSYDLYFKHSTHTLYIQANAENAAENYANYFMSAFTCDDGEHEPQFIDGVSWTSLASKYAAEVNTEGARACFKNADPDESGTIFEQVIARYKAVIEHYGTAKYSDFIGKGYEKVGSNLINPIDNNNNGVAIIVVSASVVTISLVAAFFMLKKRKESK